VKKKASFFKKLFIFFLIVLFIFLAIWIPVKGFVNIDKGNRAVVWTKFTGTIQKVYHEGTHFFPLGAIPSFCEIHKFPVIEEPVSEVILIDFPYKNLISHAGNFYIEYRVKLSYIIPDNGLLSLVQGDKYETLKKEIKISLAEAEKSFLLNRILIRKFIDSGEDFTSDSLFARLKNFTVNLLNEKFKQIKVANVEYNVIFMPDTDTYRLHFKAAEKATRTESENYIKKLLSVNYEYHNKKMISDIEIAQIKKYLELIKQGHDVLPFLFLQKLSDKIRIVVVPQGRNGVDFTKFMKYLTETNRAQERPATQPTRQGEQPAGRNRGTGNR